LKRVFGTVETVPLRNSSGSAAPYKLSLCGEATANEKQKQIPHTVPIECVETGSLRSSGQAE